VKNKYAEQKKSLYIDTDVYKNFRISNI